MVERERKKRIRINITMDPEVYELMKKQAEKESRSVSNWIENTCKRHIWLHENDY